MIDKELQMETEMVETPVEAARAPDVARDDAQREDRKVRPAPRGMTLVEIMVVIGIIGTITVVLATGVLGSSDEADKNAAGLLLNKVQSQLDLHAARSSDRKFPDSLSLLVEKGLLNEDQTKDPWGTELSYSSSGRSYELCSGGPDGSIGGGDDICVQSNRRN